MMKTLSGISLVLLCIWAGTVTVSAQQIIRPSVVTATNFAVIIDQDTYDHTRTDILAYKQMLEAQEQLGTYVVSSRWKTPEEVKAVLQQLAAGGRPLEGAVLVGKVPVVMVRNAQHMTSAFKMDELKYPFAQSSIASDRFYDDFDLRFHFVKQDEKRPLWFYYELAEASPQAISSDLYTARVLSHQPDTIAWVEISRFFQKAVAARQTAAPLEQLLAFTGSGYNSESLTAWADEQQVLRELFPAAFTVTDHNRVLNFRMDTAIKYTLFSELQRPGLDLAFLSEHGDIGKQYITEQTRITTPEIAGIRPAARMIIFNACYNGSYHHPDNIATAYLFNAGNTLVTQGNTVNVLQDKYALQLAGLLQEGIRAGIWSSQINTLESHLLGDPTWRFHRKDNEGLNSLLVKEWKNERFWKQRLKHPSQAQRSLALLRLFRLNTKDITRVAAQVFDTAASVSERMQCLSLLAGRGDAAYQAVLVRALADPNEYIRRKAAEWTAKSGDDSLVAPLVQLVLSHPSDERVIWSANRSLAVMNTVLVKQEIQRQLNAATYLLKKEALLGSWLKEIAESEAAAAKTITAIQNKTADETKRVQAIRLLRNNNYHSRVPELVQLVTDPSESPVVRQQLLEALGWFSNSYQKPLLLETCRQIAADTTAPEAVRKEATQTTGRLTQWQLL